MKSHYPLRLWEVYDPTFWNLTLIKRTKKSGYLASAVSHFDHYFFNLCLTTPPTFWKYKKDGVPFHEVNLKDKTIKQIEIISYKLKGSINL